MTKRPGRWLIAIGLFLMVLAAALAVYNMWEENKAAESSGMALEQLRHEIPLIETVPPEYIDSGYEHDGSACKAGSDDADQRGRSEECRLDSGCNLFANHSADSDSLFLRIRWS